MKDVIGPATYAGVVIDTRWRGDAGVFVNGLPGSKTGQVQISRLDPETGALSGRVRVRSDAPDGFPAWADTFVAAGTTLVNGGSVYSLARDAADVRSIVRYDFGADEPAWRWVPKKSRGLSHEVDPVAVSQDGSRVYVTAGSTFDKLALVELDAFDNLSAGGDNSSGESTRLVLTLLDLA